MKTHKPTLVLTVIGLTLLASCTKHRFTQFKKVNLTNTQKEKHKHGTHKVNEEQKEMILEYNFYSIDESLANNCKINKLVATKNISKNKTPGYTYKSSKASISNTNFTKQKEKPTPKIKVPKYGEFSTPLFKTGIKLFLISAPIIAMGILFQNYWFNLDLLNAPAILWILALAIVATFVLSIALLFIALVNKLFGR